MEQRGAGLADVMCSSGAISVVELGRGLSPVDEHGTTAQGGLRCAL